MFKMGKFERGMLVMTFILFCLGSGAMTVKVIFDRLTDDQVMLLIGGMMVLVIVAVVGMLFILVNFFQTKNQLAMLAQDDDDELKKMAKVMMLMGGGNRQPNINLRLPGGGRQPAPQMPMYVFPDNQGQPQPVDGQYQDTISVE